MPSDRSYGNILRTERERSGYDLTSMSRRLHIRPDILQAIEASDFDRMPARGYTKNMVRAYARALKLDDQRITSMFLDEMNMHESGVARRSAADQRSSYGAGQGHSRRQPSRGREDEEEPSRGRQPRSAGRLSSRNGRDLIDPNPARPRNTRSRHPQETPARSRSRQSQNASQGGIGERVAMGVGSFVGSFTQGRGRQETKVPRNFNTIGSTPPYARSGSAAGGGGFGSMNLPMVLAVIAAVIVLLIVVVVISNGSKQASEDVPDIPISGLTDTSSPEDSTDATTVDSVPEFAVFTYAVQDGKKAWLEIYENDEEDPVVSEVVEGPKEETFEVRDTLTIRTAAPDYVTLTLDGEEVDFEKVSGSQYYAFTVDFADILNQWNIDHGRGASGAKSSSSKSSSSSSSSKSRSSSSGSSSSKSSSSSSSRSS